MGLLQGACSVAVLALTDVAQDVWSPDPKQIGSTFLMRLRPWCQWRYLRTHKQYLVIHNDASWAALPDTIGSAEVFVALLVNHLQFFLTQLSHRRNLLAPAVGDLIVNGLIRADGKVQIA